MLDAIKPIRTMSRLCTTIPPFNEVLSRRRCWAWSVALRYLGGSPCPFKPRSRSWPLRPFLPSSPPALPRSSQRPWS